MRYRWMCQRLLDLESLFVEERPPFKTPQRHSPLLSPWFPRPPQTSSELFFTPLPPLFKETYCSLSAPQVGGSPVHAQLLQDKIKMLEFFFPLAFHIKTFHTFLSFSFLHPTPTLAFLLIRSRLVQFFPVKFSTHKLAHTYIIWSDVVIPQTG